MERSLQSFEWKCHPEAEQWILSQIDAACRAYAEIARFRERLLTETSTRLLDWIDHLVLPYEAETATAIEQFGFCLQETTQEGACYHHPGAQLPRVVLQEGGQRIELFLNADHICDFLLAWGRNSCAPIEGSYFGNYRRSLIDRGQAASLWVVERRGTQSLEPTQESAEEILSYAQALELWQKRPRCFQDVNEGMRAAHYAADQLIEKVGVQRAAWTVLEVERVYWQMRNRAGQIQKNRQDHLGLGWANHDHHTFRSSRTSFKELVLFFEKLGFYCRERFYAGKEAGWGAQVMENPTCRLVLFLDVDLSPEEIEVDFAHTQLEELDSLGTIGLWCALHGDSLFQAGMHHLEAQFMFEELQRGLASAGISMMHPFSNFPFLKQAFTEGERWRVDEAQVELLLKTGKITPEHAKKFKAEGAIGSHLENLQRREGYKGFNQKNVSAIIKRTDPRAEQ